MLLVDFLKNQIKPLTAHAKAGGVKATPFFVYAKSVNTSLGVQTENLNHVRTPMKALERRLAWEGTDFALTP
jgi:hypothetical protein